MKFIADFHIHSKYSRSVSPLMNLKNLDKWAKIKGIKVLGTGDFTHPKWIKEIKKQLSPAESGLFKLKKSKTGTRFILTSEISCIYKKLGKVRKIHIIVLAPSIETVEKINIELNKIGNLKSDGRPILGLDAKELLRIIISIDKNCLVVPAHVWTPWFSIFGSKSGFDNLEECFDEYTKYIFAIETGLCSNPAMNWGLSKLDKITLISNSDAHSLAKIGREANVFNTTLSYGGILSAIKNPRGKFLYTIEFFPEEGKYYYDGHRACNISLDPNQSKENNNICPVCGKPLVIGVLNRVKLLADREEGIIPKNRVPYISLISLNEVIAKSTKSSISSKVVLKHYNNLIKNLGSELEVLLNSTEKEIRDVTLPEIAQGIIKMRKEELSIIPGYDGVYGKISF